MTGYLVPTVIEKTTAAQQGRLTANEPSTSTHASLPTALSSSAAK